MKEKPIVGQKLYSLNVGSAARRTKQKLTPMIVTKVGRKYFTCQPEGGRTWMNVQFHLDSWNEKTEYLSAHCLYSNPQEWEDDKAASRICRKIYESFQYGHNKLDLSLGKLKQIDKIISDSSGQE